MLFTFQNWRVFLSPRTKEPVIIYRLGLCVCVCVGGGGGVGGIYGGIKWFSVETEEGQSSHTEFKGGRGTVEYWLPMKDVR